MADLQEADAEDLLQAAPETTSLDTASDVENEVVRLKLVFILPLIPLHSCQQSSSSFHMSWQLHVYFVRR
jgi:hypothetical protein